jgi:hypothetical protein
MILFQLVYVFSPNQMSHFVKLHTSQLDSVLALRVGRAAQLPETFRSLVFAMEDLATLQQELEASLQQSQQQLDAIQAALASGLADEVCRYFFSSYLYR